MDRLFISQAKDRDELKFYLGKFSLSDPEKYNKQHSLGEKALYFKR